MCTSSTPELREVATYEGSALRAFVERYVNADPRELVALVGDVAQPREVVRNLIVYLQVQEQHRRAMRRSDDVVEHALDTVRRAYWRRLPDSVRHAMVAQARATACEGSLVDGPAKAFGRCDTCGRIDYEGYEGDACPW